MTFWAVVLYAAVILVAILLIALVLVQQSKGGGFGGAFGGLGESIFGAQGGSHLTKLTVILGTIFFVLVLAIAVLISHGGATRNTETEVDDLLSKQTVEKVAEGTKKAAEGTKKAAAELKTDVKVPEKK